VPKAAPRLPDEAVHLAAVDVANRVEVLVRAAVVLVRAVVVGPDAATPEGVRHPDREAAVAARDAVGSGIRAEEAVEGAVLLHHDDDVADLVDARGARAGRSARESEAPGNRDGNGENDQNRTPRHRRRA